MSQQETNSAAAPVRTDERYALTAVLGITALTYIGTLRFDFAGDDTVQISENPYIKSWRYLPHLFVNSFWSHVGVVSHDSFYRPIYQVWDLLNYSLFKLDPLGWHATAILMHVLVTALVYLLVRELVPSRPNLALLTALIFGVHPIHHEVVAWISGATESVCAAFLLGAFLAYFRSRRSHQIAHRITWMALSCALYGFAIFSKETAIILPALIFVCEWLASRPKAAAEPAGLVPRFNRIEGRIEGRIAASVLPYVPIAAAYLVIRLKVLGSFSNPPVHMNFFELLVTWPSVLVFYLRHWLLPFGYSWIYSFAYYAGLNLRGVIVPALILLACAGGLWLLGRGLGGCETGYAAAWILIPLLPALDLGVFPLHELAHDRYFYVPSIGAALLIALLLEPIGKSGPRLWGQPRALVLTTLLLTAGLSFSAALAANQWSDDLALYTRGYETAPQSPVVRDGLAAQRIAQGRFSDARELLEPVVQETPGYWSAWVNLGRVNYAQQNFAEAETDLSRAIQLNPKTAVAYVLLGQTQIKTGRMPDALVSMRRGVELLPDEFRFRIIYGAVLQASGDCPSAVAQFNAALALQPNEGIAQRGLAMCHAVTPSSLAQSAPITR